MHAHTPARKSKILKSKIAKTIFQKSIYSEKGDPSCQASGGSCKAWRRQVLRELEQKAKAHAREDRFLKLGIGKTISQK